MSFLPFLRGIKRDELKGTFAVFRRSLLIFAFPGIYKICCGAQGAERILGEIFLLKHLEGNSGSRFMAHSGLLSQHSLTWHDFDLAFRNLGSSPLQWLLSPSVPPQPRPQSSESLALAGWPKSVQKSLQKNLFENRDTPFKSRNGGCSRTLLARFSCDAPSQVLENTVRQCSATV